MWNEMPKKKQFTVESDFLWGIQNREEGRLTQGTRVCALFLLSISIKKIWLYLCTYITLVKISKFLNVRTFQSTELMNESTHLWCIFHQS